MKCWLFLFLMCSSAAHLFGAFPIEAIIFDQDGSGPLTSTGVITLDSSTMGVADLENVQIVGPESNTSGAAVGWVQNGTAIQAITFDQDGSGPLTTSGIIPLGIATGSVTFFQLSGSYPEVPTSGSVAAWVEGGTDIKAVIFDQDGSGPLTTTGVISLGTAGGTVTHFQLISDVPESNGTGAVVAWVENGTNIRAIIFDQDGAGPLTNTGIISLGTATGNITTFQLAGSYPEAPNFGAVVAWVEDGLNIKAIIFDQNGAGPLTSTGIISLGTAGGTVTGFNLGSSIPEASGFGSAVGWVENGTDIKAITFDQHGAGPLTTSGIISLGTATGNITAFQFRGFFSELPTYGAVATWVEDGLNIKAITFDQYGAGPLTTSGIISLGTAAATVSSFQLRGDYPEQPGFGPAVAWVENGTDIKAITFDQDGSGPLTTSGIIFLGSATSGPVTSFQLSGSAPENPDSGAVVTWIVGRVAPQKSRPFLRPSNRR
jgi:hypothetical protein